MKSRTVFCLLVLVLALGVHSGAQLSVEASPNPAPQGTAIKLKVEASIPAELQLACPLDVRAGSPNGAIVWTVGPCIFLRVIISPGSPYNNMGWNGQNNSQKPVAPGTYYIHIKWKPLNSSQPFTSHFVPVRVDPTSGPTDPVLATTSAAKRGAPFDMTLSAPNNPSDIYVAAASFTTNAGFNISASEHVALDADPLFFLSLLQVPGLFNNFQGRLDAFGNVKFSMNMPNISSLQGAQVAVQCVVIDSQNSRRWSNPITRVIL